MSKKIVVLGSCNTDMVIKSERLPEPGETIIGGIFLMNPGGKGANQAVAASRLGGEVTFICKIGNDLFGQQAVELYRKENINTDYVFKDDEVPSGVALIMVDANGENSIVVASGANYLLDKEDVDQAKEVIENSDLLLMQLETPIETILHAAKLAKKGGAKVILNPAPAQSMPAELLEQLYMIAPNKTEAEMLSGVSISDWKSARFAADKISDKGGLVVVITLGDMGALVKDGDHYYEIPIPLKIEAVDTTAAGDTFCGGLSVGIVEGMNLPEAVKFAHRAAGLSIMKMGAQTSIPYREDLESNLYSLK